MAVYYWLNKDAKHYKTQSRFLRRVCVNFMGYTDGGYGYNNFGRQLLPFKLSKEERDKYKVALRLMN